MAPINCILFPASKTKGEEEKNAIKILPSVHSVQGKDIKRVRTKEWKERK
jgi:hypothetical protein